RPAAPPAWTRPPVYLTAGRDSSSGSARTGIEHPAVQVHVELDRREAERRVVQGLAERRVRALAAALRPGLAGVADVVIGPVLGVAHPLAVGLGRGLVRGEVVPA